MGSAIPVAGAAARRSSAAEAADDAPTVRSHRDTSASAPGSSPTTCTASPLVAEVRTPATVRQHRVRRTREGRPCLERQRVVALRPDGDPGVGGHVERCGVGAPALQRRAVGAGEHDGADGSGDEADRHDRAQRPAYAARCSETRGDGGRREVPAHESRERHPQSCADETGCGQCEDGQRDGKRVPADRDGSDGSARGDQRTAVTTMTAASSSTTCQAVASRPSGQTSTVVVRATAARVSATSDGSASPTAAVARAIAGGCSGWDPAASSAATQPRGGADHRSRDDRDAGPEPGEDRDAAGGSAAPAQETGDLAMLSGAARLRRPSRTRGPARRSRRRARRTCSATRWRGRPRAAVRRPGRTGPAPGSAARARRTRRARGPRRQVRRGSDPLRVERCDPSAAVRELLEGGQPQHRVGVGTEQQSRRRAGIEGAWQQEGVGAHAGADDHETERRVERGRRRRSGQQHLAPPWGARRRQASARDPHLRASSSVAPTR